MRLVRSCVPAVVIEFGYGVAAGFGLSQTPTTEFGQRVMIGIMLYRNTAGFGR